MLIGVYFYRIVEGILSKSSRLVDLPGGSEQQSALHVAVERRKSDIIAVLFNKVSQYFSKVFVSCLSMLRFIKSRVLEPRLQFSLRLNGPNHQVLSIHRLVAIL